MTDRLEETWTNRDFPVLREIVRIIDSQVLAGVRSTEVEAALPHLSVDDIQRAAMNLNRAGLIDMTGASGVRFMRVINVSERAMRLAGLWPDEEQAADQLLWILEQKVEAATTPEERTKWQRVRDSLVGAGRDFTVELAAAMAARSMGA